MSDPNEIRAEIDRTRAEVGHDVDALAEKVSPSRAVGRQTDRIRERVDHVRESVMGSSEGPGVRDRTADLAHQAGDAVGRAPAASRGARAATHSPRASSPSAPDGSSVR